MKLHISECGPVELFLNRERAESEKEIIEKFVAPPIIRQELTSNERSDEIHSNRSNEVNVEEILKSSANEIIVAAPEHGRTILLRYLQYRMMVDAKDFRQPNLPLFIDFSDLKTNANAVLRSLKASSISLPDGVTVEGLLKLGYCTILVDDVDFSNAGRLRILKDFIGNFSKSRYIISSPKGEAFTYGGVSVPEMPLHFGLLEICALRRKQMRQLVQKYNREVDHEILLEKLHAEFSQMNLPFTAANGTILMEIYEAHPNFRAINRSVVIEQFVDASLRKAAVEQIRRETFDYSNKTSLLAAVASWMAMEDNYKPRYEDVRGYVVKYLDSLGLLANVDDLLAEFLSARIIVRRSEGRMSFRYRSVLEYFIALHMSDDVEFRNWFFSEENYLQYINEIQFYAGKNRSETAILDIIGQRFSDIIRSVKAEFVDIDVNKIANVNLPVGEKSSIDDLAVQLNSPPMSEEERDEEIEEEIPRDVEDRQEVFRPKVADLGSQLLVSLFLYSGALKNLETIKDIDKRRHMSAILDGWSIFLHLSLLVVPMIASKRKYRVNGVTYIVNAPLSMSNEDLGRMIALNLPSGISTWVNAALGTEKLERQLSEPLLGAEAEPLIFEFFKVALMADLRLPTTPDAVRVFFEKSRGSRYLVEALIWKMKEVRRLNKIADDQFSRATPHLATAIADLKGGNKASRDKEKGQQIQKIRRQAVYLKLSRKKLNEDD